MNKLIVLESQLFSCLSHPKRLELLRVLTHGPATVSELISMSGLAQATVSQHLMQLKKLGIVSVTKDGQQRRYALASPAIHALFTASRSYVLHRHGVDSEEAINRLHVHTDPVCGMEVVARSAAASAMVGTTRYYFCGNGCHKRFLQDPASYTTQQGVTYV